MSAKNGRRFLVTLVMVMFMGWVTPMAVQAEAPDQESGITPWVDYLQTNPLVLESGKVLPGDTVASLCSKDVVVTSPLSLAEAVNLALCHNPQVQSAWAAIKVQAAALGEARAAYLPTLSASTSLINDRLRDISADTATTQTSNTVYGNLSWRLFDFGGREANRHSTNALLNAALANHDAVLQKTLAGVVGAYFDAQTAQAMWETKQKNESLTQQTLEIARRREVRGAGAVSDSLQAATALAKASLERGRAQGAYHKALSVLIFSLGVPTSTHLTLAQDLADQTDSIQQDLDAWLVQVQTQHPALIAARAQLESAQEKVVATRAEGLPTLDMTGSYFQNGRPNQGLTPRTDETMVGVTVSFPLFEGFTRTYKIRGAQAQVEQKEAEAHDTEHQILMEVVKAHADASAALDNLTASQKLLTAAQDALSTVQRKFDRGAADILEILNTQSALSDAQQERVRCLADWRSARLRLLAAAGLLGHKDIGSP